MCSYMRLGADFLRSLDLPDNLFNHDHDKCYCEICHIKSGADEYYTRGVPPKSYGLPLGWCRFSLKLQTRNKLLNVKEEWHQGYHGTRSKHVRDILKVGDLVPVGSDIIGKKKVREEDGHFSDDDKPAGFDTKQVFLSPTIRYAGIDCYARPVQFRARNGKAYTTRVAFQVYIEPGSYTESAETMGACGRPFDPRIPNSRIEWSTKKRGATMLSGLLFKFEKFEFEPSDAAAPYRVGYAQRVKSRSGIWVGHYYEDGSRHGFDMEIIFRGDKVSGGGSDNVGSFTIDGKWREENGGIAFTKQYHRAHAIRYKGQLSQDGRSMEGKYNAGIGFMEKFKMARS